MYIAICLKNLIFVFYIVVVVVVVVVATAAAAAAVCCCVHTLLLCLNIEINIILSYLCILIYTLFLHASN